MHTIRLDLAYNHEVYGIDAYPVGEWADLRRVQGEFLDHTQAYQVTQTMQGEDRVPHT